MAQTPSKFKLGEDLSLVGNTMHVAGILQLEDPAGQVSTRYLLTGGASAAQLLEETGDSFALLRPFPPATQPQAAGDSVSVMGEKYTLAGISKFKVSSTGGEAPCGLTEGSALLSGKFEGPLGTLVREIVPGNPAQNFFAVKPVPSSDVLTGAQVAAIQSAEMHIREERAQAGAETESEGGAGKKIIRFVIAILVVVGLVYACSSSDDSGSTSGSARTSSSGFHGK